MDQKTLAYAEFGAKLTAALGWFARVGYAYRKDGRAIYYRPEFEDDPECENKIAAVYHSERFEEPHDGTDMSIALAMVRLHERAMAYWKEVPGDTWAGRNEGWKP